MNQKLLVNKFVLILISIFMLITFSNYSSYAHPVVGEQFELKQPDGSLVPVKIWGDEYFQHVESLDGYSLIRDQATQYICFARLNNQGDELQSTGQVYSEGATPITRLDKHLKTSAKIRLKQVIKNHSQVMNITQATAAGVSSEELSLFAPPSIPTVGNRYGLCLLIDFPDEAGTISQTEVDNYCNQPGYNGYGNDGSIRDYFLDVSNNLLDYSNTVTAYYTAINNKGYYDNPSEGAGPKARELILEALNWLDTSGFDFSTLDGNNDGRIDGINAYYAGTVSSGWAKGLWPHSGYIFYSADGVTSYKYQITYMGTSLRLQTFCHENGHMLCLFPDFYDYGGESFGVGRYCLMAYGSSNSRYPMEVSAYLKEKAGWMTITDISINQFAFGTLTHNTNHAYRYINPIDSKEYFLAEVRIKADRDTGLPDEGLAIWHIDETGSNNNEQMTEALHYECSLIQADNLFHLENHNNYGDTNDFFTATQNDSFTDTTSPDGLWWNGDPSGIYIRNISAAGPTMTFMIGPPIPDLIVESISTSQTAVKAGASVIFSVKVKNIGGIATSGFTVGFWDHLNEPPTIASTGASTLTSGGLSIGQSVILDFTAVNVTAGNKKAFAFVDMLDGIGEISEFNENNNVGPGSGYDWTVISSSPLTPTTYLGPDKVLAIYPNPARSVMYFHLASKEQRDITILVYNFSGELVSKVTQSISGQEVAIPWNVAHVAQGIYIVRILMNNKLIKQSKIVITR